jgi:hypothetical protein
MAYFFGFVQADGTHSGRCDTKGSVVIELSVHTTTTWTLCSREARLMLACLGLPPCRKSGAIAPPSMAFSRRDYMRGLIDADGSVGITSAGLPFVGFTTASPEMSRFVCDTAFDVTGERRTVNPNTRDGVYNFMLTREAAVTLASWLYYDGCLALRRKHAGAEQASRWRRPPGMKVRPPRQAWTAEHDRVVQEMGISEAAGVLGRTEQSVRLRRWRLRQASGLA